MSSLTGITKLNLGGCPNVTAAAKQAAALPNLTMRTTYGDSTTVQLLSSRPSAHALHYVDDPAPRRREGLAKPHCSPPGGVV
jgi:hypothetical protein